MSNRLAMPALDKVEKKFSVRVETLTRLEKRASKAGIPLATYVNRELDHLVEDDPCDIQMLERIKELMDANVRRRETLKTRKGLV